ncbi:MAG TPA: acyltransferase [Crocinitomix sp.]|nr:acyltransferase [Crocinitomix sp.]
MITQKNIKLERPHFKNLDGLRFLAALSVFIFHFVSELKVITPGQTKGFYYHLVSFVTSKGTLGVNFFFVLSGFLITYLILYEIKTTKSFNLKYFLIRRTLRIWPLYFLIVVIGFLVFPLVFNGYSTNHRLINYVFFLANFDELYYGINDSINFLTAPWSVAIEEQFYLFWGVLFYVLSKTILNKQLTMYKLPLIVLVLLLLSFMFRLYHHTEHRLLYYHTIAVMPDILIGALLGYFYMLKHRWIKSLENLSKNKIILVYFIGLSIILFKNQIFFGPFIVLERFVIALFFAFVILDQISFNCSFLKVENIKGTAFLGKISYGLYMYHLVVMYVLEKSIDFGSLNDYVSITLFFILSVFLTFIIALLSYQWFEHPFLTLKKKFKL